METEIKEAKVSFEQDLIELLKKYGIESKQIIQSIEIKVRLRASPKVSINQFVVNFPD